MAHPATPQRNDRALVASAVVLISALAWAYLVHLHREMSSLPTSGAMANMGMMVDTPWRAADIAFTFAMWSVMMVGMMGPSAMPMLLLVSASQSRRTDRRATMHVPLFALGYLAIWIGFSACATLTQWALHDGALLSSTMAAANPRLAGALLIVAGAYQLTPAKHACLAHCQTPMGFLMSHWREGPSGAFQMGLRHGLYCLGCCWALMGVLFAVGVMNLVWVAALTAFILLERAGHVGARVARVGGVLMMVLGALALLGWRR